MKKLYFVVLVLLFGCQNKNNVLLETSDKSITNQSITLETYLEIIEVLLVGYTTEAVSTHMVTTPHQFLGASEGRANYETEDREKVKHFVSFAFVEDLLTYYVYDLNFKNVDSQGLMQDYLLIIRRQLESTFGDEFETGYNQQGNYTVNWVLEGVKVDLVTGVDFISIDVYQY